MKTSEIKLLKAQKLSKEISLPLDVLHYSPIVLDKYKFEEIENYLLQKNL